MHIGADHTARHLARLCESSLATRNSFISKGINVAVTIDRRVEGDSGKVALTPHHLIVALQIDVLQERSLVFRENSIQSLKVDRQLTPGDFRILHIWTNQRWLVQDRA